MKTMDGLADDLYDTCKNIITGMDYPVQPTEDEETKQIRLRSERNYQKLENLRKNTLVPLSNFIKDKMKDVWDIYDTYIVPFEETDDDYRKKINAIYEKRTSEEDKKSNNWDFGLKVGSAFVKGFGLAFVGAVALALAPGWLAVGIIAALAVGSVVMAFVLKQYVLSWMQGAKDVADNMAQLSVRALDEGPLVYVEAIGQGTMDTIQTPEGIAAVSGATVGGVLGGVAGTKIKAKISKPKVKTEDISEVDPPNKTKDVEIEEPEVPKKTDVDEDLPPTEKNTAIEGGSYASPNKIDSLLDGRPELTGSTRDKLLDTVQDPELRKIVNELYRPGATVGDGGTAAILVEEFGKGSSTHLLKATERLKQLKKLASSGKLGLNDLDVVEALIDDLESAISLYN